MTGRRSSGGCLVRFLLAMIFLVAIAAGAAHYSATRPYQGFRSPVILEFPKGTSTPQMAAQLQQAGVIRYAWQFVVARALRPRARLMAGEYQFSQPASLLEVFDRLARGDVFFYELTVPEGSNIFDIAANVGRFDFLHSADFLRIARDPSLIRDLAPNAPSLEGYLFPSTYRITRSTTAEQLCRMMTDLFRKHWRELQSGDRALEVNSTVTLASLVEKETATADERTLVSSVFANRLRIGMPLDCDPTAIYAALLEDRYHGTIYRSDLESANPYNTYRHAGLPPGPIANPGAASLQAAISPADTRFLYFVAKPDHLGGHHFSETIDEHNRAVQQYRHVGKPKPPTAAPARVWRHHGRK